MPQLTFKHVVLALVGALLPALLTAPSAVLAAGTEHDQTRPQIMKQVGDAVAASSSAGLQPFTAPKNFAPVGGASSARPAREVYGFADGANLENTSTGIHTWNFTELSTVAYFGLHVNAADGSFLNDGGWQHWNSSDLTDLINTARPNGVKVVLTIIYQDTGPGMCTALQHRSTTAANTVQEVIAKQVDGVNVDYEGVNAACAGSSNQALLTDLVAQIKNALLARWPQGSYVSVDTYASSAADPGGFFGIPALNPYTDSFFVMAYALELSNAGTSVCSTCLSPTSPIAGYHWNLTDTTNQYLAAVGPGKTILGLPYYGVKGCVSSYPAPPNSPIIGGFAREGAETYLDASTDYQSFQPYSAARDPLDGAGQERMDSFFSTTANCNRQMYWDDTTSLGLKYDLVNRAGLRGVGIWNLNYGGGAPELWSTLAAHFNCPASVGVGASQGSTAFTVSLSAPCSGTYDVQQYDNSMGAGWFDVGSTSAAQLAVNGFAGHTYQFRARMRTPALTSAWSSPVTTMVAASATNPHAFGYLYTLDGFGGVHAADSPPLATGSYWPNWDVARAAKPLPGSQSGVLLDALGGLHGYGAGATFSGYDYFGWNIARDVALLADGSGGYVLDGWGGIHAFGINGHARPPAARGYAYWQGWDIARRIVLFPDGTGGYVLDGWGGLHPFALGASPVPATPSGSVYWKGWDIARGLALVPGSQAGYILDGWGGLHPFGGAAAIGAPGYWPGLDIARAVVLDPGSTPGAPAGFVLDGSGGLHPFGGAPPISNGAFWPGWDIARGLAAG